MKLGFIQEYVASRVQRDGIVTHCHPQREMTCSFDTHRTCCVGVTSLVLICLLGLQWTASATLTVTGSTSYNYGNYVSDYIRLVNSDTWTWEAAAAGCEAHGTGWHIAGIYSAEGTAAVVSILNPADGSAVQGYIGAFSPLGLDFSVPNLLVWVGGRFQGEKLDNSTPPRFLAWVRIVTFEPARRSPLLRCGRSRERHTRLQ